MVVANILGAGVVKNHRICRDKDGNNTCRTPGVVARKPVCRDRNLGLSMALPFIKRQDKIYKEQL